MCYILKYNYKPIKSLLDMLNGLLLFCHIHWANIYCFIISVKQSKIKLRNMIDNVHNVEKVGQSEHFSDQRADIYITISPEYGFSLHSFQCSSCEASCSRSAILSLRILNMHRMSLNIHSITTC